VVLSMVIYSDSVLAEKGCMFSTGAHLMIVHSKCVLFGV